MKIGFVGLGHMGQPMVKHLISSEHNVTVFDINKEVMEVPIAMGAKAAYSPRDVMEASELVFTSLPTPEIVEEIALGEGGLMEASVKGKAYFDLSTTDPDTMKRIAAIGAQQGIAVFDSPVSGGTDGAQRGSLCIMVGGDERIFREYRSILKLMGTQVIYCGALGSGAICKIVNNLIGMTTNLVLSEAFSLGVKAGMNPQMLYDVISESSGNSFTLHNFANGLFKRDFTPGFQINLAEKDVGLAVDMGKTLGVPMIISSIARQRFIEAQSKGWGKDAICGIARLQEEAAGILIEPTKDSS